MKVALFITCLTDSFFPRAGIAAVKVLEHLGHQVEFPPTQTCCGQPMFNNGFHHDARTLARRMVRVFAPFETVVTPSASCAAMVRRHFPELLASDPMAPAARALAARTYEFTEFLITVLEVDPRQLGVRWEGTATYHGSCHLRSLGASDEAPRLIGRIDGLDYVPLEMAEQCCGFGGTFSVGFPAISGAMARDKVDCIRETAADTVISNEAGCTMNIAGACRREGCPAQFRSLAEIIAEGLGLMDREEA